MSMQSGPPVMTALPLKLLLVEDHEPDVRWARMVLSEANLPCDVSVLNDGEHVRKYLERQRPDLILLDINMPRVDGSEVLRQLKESAEYREIPVCMVTSSRAEKQRFMDLYQLHGQCYVEKPITLEALHSALSCYPTLRAYAELIRQAL